MATRLTRDNAHYLPAIRAVVLGVAAYTILTALPFYPTWLMVAIAAAVAATGLRTPALSAVLFVTSMSLPLLAADFVVGVLFLIVGFSATQYLAADRAGGFIAIAAAIAVLPHGGAWAAAVLAGYLFGAGPGMVAAAIACVLIEVAGILVGVPHLGPVIAATPVTEPILTFRPVGEALLSFRWLTEAIAEADPGRVASAVLDAQPFGVLVTQPIAWGVAAAAGGVFRRPHGTPRERIAAIAGVSAVTFGLGIATVMVTDRFDVAVDPTVLFRPLIVSMVASGCIAALSEWVFALRETPAGPAPAARATSSVRTEDADVDELLRLIASAEEELATRHTTHAVVMITDMKSFSRMTEEIGSIASAKIVQRHRDMLLPVIETHGGHGKSTGGDGLVAAFGDAGDAIAAAIDMQRTLQEHTSSGDLPGDVSIRIGVADGEVVLDAGGRPFIGAALNLAARVMGLADGGRILVTGPVADAASIPGDARHEHGSFRLKNIARPVRVVEVLWQPRQQPMTVDSVPEAEPTDTPGRESPGR